MGFWEGNQTSVFIKFCSSPLLGNQCPTLPLTLVRQWRNHPSYWRFEWKRNSDCNTSYNPPVHKPNSNWRLTVNYWCLDSDLGPLTAAIPNIAELIATIQEQAHKITAPYWCQGYVFYGRPAGRGSEALLSCEMASNTLSLTSHNNWNTHPL